MRSLLLIMTLMVTLYSCSTHKQISSRQVEMVVDKWHQAAGAADFDTYFDLMSDDAVFIGTQASENWQLQEFKSFARPYFEAGKAWSFTPLQRNVYTHNGVVYFDELLETQMGICRGSGVIKIQNNRPVIAHYVLSIAVPNDQVTSLTAMKKEWDQEYIKKLQTSQR